MVNWMGKALPEIKLFYLLAVSALLFATADARVIGGLLVFQAGLWLISAIGWGALKRLARRLVILFLVIGLSYGFFSIGGGSGGGGDDWVTVGLGPLQLEVNRAGLAVAAIMCLRVLVLVMASAWVRESGNPGDFVRALVRFRLPLFLAAAIDGALGLAAGRGGGQGRGGGKGRGGKSGGQVSEAITLAQIRSGKLALVRDILARSLSRSTAFIAENNPALGRDQARDVAIIMAVAVAVMSLKVLQVMPGLPIAPGHKNLLIVPFLLLAARLTTMRLGGLWAGLTTGIVSVMLGFGKYGVLEIAHFAVPGLLADVLMPLAGGLGFSSGSRVRRLAGFAVIGALLGTGRFAANLLVIILAGAPVAAFLLYLPMLLSQVLFGALSSFVALALVDAAWSIDDTPSGSNGAGCDNLPH